MSVRRGATLLALVALATATAGSLGACGVGYILQQGVGQLEMLGRREPIARVLREPDLPAETRDRLVLVWHARAFAINALGLHASESYRDVVRLDRDAASYVVAAAPQDSLEPYRWCFPIAGCLPYIGYFHRADAEREKARMIGPRLSTCSCAECPRTAWAGGCPTRYTRRCSASRAGGWRTR